MGECLPSSNKENTNEIRFIAFNPNQNENSILSRNNKVFLMRDTKNDNMNLIVHRNDGMNDYIIEMNISKFSDNNFSKDIEFILILDKSGSMGNNVHRLISSIIPRVLNLLNYSDNDIIHLITFESYVNLHHMTVRDLKNNYDIIGYGGTEMSGVFNKVREILCQSHNKSNYRILALSDGIIYDQEKTKEEAEILKTYVDRTDFSISVGSIRFYSGYDCPDTKALSSVLILNTINSKYSVLTEISSCLDDEQISQKIYELFKDDYFASNVILKSENIKFRIDPWKEGKNEVKLLEGQNLVWADKNPSMENNIGIYEGGKLKYTKEDFKNGYEIKYSTYNEILGEKLKMTLRKVRINKSSGSRAALEENEKIIAYYNEFEKKLKDNNNKTALITNELKRINEINVSKFDNQQLAQFIGVDNNNIPIEEFLRNIIKKKKDKNEENNIENFAFNIFKDFLQIKND